MGDLDALIADENLGPAQLDRLVQQLNNNIYQLREEIDSTISTQLKLFPDVFTTTQSLANQITELNRKADLAYSKVLPQPEEEFNLLMTRYEMHHSALSKASDLLASLNLIRNFHESLKTLENSIEAKNYAKGAREYSILSSLSEELSSKGLDETKIIANALKSLKSCRKALIHEMKSTLESYLNTENLQNVTITTLKDTELPIFSILEKLGILQESLEDVCPELLECIYIPCLHKRVETKSSRGQIEVSDDETLTLKQKLASLRRLSQALQSSFLSEVLDGTPVNHIINPLIGEKLVSNVLSACSSHIPVSIEDYKTFDVSIIQETERCLIDQRFSTENCLQSFYGDFPHHFVKSKVSQVLSTGRDVVRKPLHDTVEISQDDQDTSMEEAFELPSLIPGGCLPEDLLRLPQITISRSTQEFRDLVETTILDSLKLDEPIAFELYRCARNLVSMFSDLSVLCHASETDSLPFIAIVQYNNHMYMAHYCQILGLIPLQHPGSFLVKNVHISALTFIDFVPELRRKADAVFNDCLQRQKTSIAETLSQYQKSQSQNSCNFSQYSICLKQALHQSSQLCSTWKPPVLSPSKFRWTLVQLMLLICDHVSSLILGLEDITSSELPLTEKILQNCEDEVSSIVSELAFGNSDPILDSISSYKKVPCIRRVLGLSLSEIQECWAKRAETPFALNAGELKSLIRALFQNTDLRAKVLSKIVD